MPASQLLALFLVSLLFSQTAGADCAASSGKQTLPLLELYTSEGCSSCPPADQWLHGLTAQGYDASKLVALAFHVDYWDYIGWRDRFAKAGYSERQRQVNAAAGSSFVYTPQFTLNGKDMRGWQQSARLDRALRTLANTPPMAKLTIRMLAATASAQAQLHVQAQLVDKSTAGNMDAYIALYENDLTSEVHAGENAGRQLRHDYVVRELYGPYRLDAANQNGWQQQLAWDTAWAHHDGQPRNTGVATFVQDRRSGQVIEALSLKSCL